MSGQPITIALAHGSNLYREGLRCLIGRNHEFEVVGEAVDGFDAVDLVRRTHPRVTLIGIPLPSRDGLDTTREILSLGTGTQILALGSRTVQGYAIRVLRAGAHGFISTSASARELVEAIHRVQRGRVYIPRELQELCAERYFSAGSGTVEEEADRLTDREFQVMCLLASGCTNKEVADRLCIGLKTVDTHRSRIIKKLHLRNNADIARFAVKKQLIQP
jgi:two-component system, NarL family, invasion response regulator UvrY